MCKWSVTSLKCVLEQIWFPIQFSFSNKENFIILSLLQVFVFSVTNQNWKQYSWSKITTLVECGYHDNDLLNHAHSWNASVVFLGSFIRRPYTQFLYTHQNLCVSNWWFLWHMWLSWCDYIFFSNVRYI